MSGHIAFMHRFVCWQHSISIFIIRLVLNLKFLMVKNICSLFSYVIQSCNAGHFFYGLYRHIGAWCYPWSKHFLTAISFSNQARHLRVNTGILCIWICVHTYMYKYISLYTIAAHESNKEICAFPNNWVSYTLDNAHYCLGWLYIRWIMG